MVTDTHVFLWYALDDSRLAAPIRSKMMSNPEDVYVPSICFWEIMILVEKGRISIGSGDLAKRLNRYVKVSGFKVAPLTLEIALLSRTLVFHHDDPADRFIAATAKALNQPLATSDERLRRLEWLDLVS